MKKLDLATGSLREADSFGANPCEMASICMSYIFPNRTEDEMMLMWMLRKEY